MITYIIGAVAFFKESSVWIWLQFLYFFYG